MPLSKGEFQGVSSPTNTILLAAELYRSRMGAPFPKMFAEGSNSERQRRSFFTMSFSIAKLPITRSQPATSYQGIDSTTIQNGLDNRRIYTVELSASLLACFEYNTITMVSAFTCRCSGACSKQVQASAVHVFLGYFSGNRTAGKMSFTLLPLDC